MVRKVQGDRNPPPCNETNSLRQLLPREGGKPVLRGVIFGHVRWNEGQFSQQPNRSLPLFLGDRLNGCFLLGLRLGRSFLLRCWISCLFSGAPFGERICCLFSNSHIIFLAICG
jgi:hypothetical protein